MSDSLIQAKKFADNSQNAVIDKDNLATVSIQLAHTYALIALVEEIQAIRKSTIHIFPDGGGTSAFLLAKK